MNANLNLPRFTLLSLLVLPLSACDQGETDLGEMETETSSTSGGSASETMSTTGESSGEPSSGSESMTSGGTAPMTSGETTAMTTGESETATSGSSGDSLYPAACEAAGWVESYDVWQAAETSGSYTFVAQETSYVDLGTFQCQYNTTITVENGAVVARSFELIEQAEGAECEEDFTETSKDLGTMDVPGAHPAITMDEVYLTCCENQLDLPEEDWISTFTVDKAGLLAHCSTRMADCADGCNQGGAGEASIIEYSFE